VRRRAGAFSGALLGLALLAGPSARAQPSAGAEPAGGEPVEAVIQIEQAPGSEVCPDKEAIFRSIRRLFPEREFRQSSDAAKSTARARVTIRPLAQGHEAVLTLLPPRRGERVIQEQDKDCRGLADALALAFVMLVAPRDPDAESELTGDASKPGAAAAAQTPDVAGVPPRKSVQQQESVRASQTEPTAETERAPNRAARSVQAGVGASLIGALGALSKPALGVGGEVELFHRSGWGFSLQGLRLWSQPAEAEGGSVTLTLWGVLAAPCYRRRLAVASRVDACLRLGIGSQYAQVNGFLSPQSSSYPWLVLVPQLSYRQGFTGLGELLAGFVRVGLIAQLQPQAFSVRLADGSGENVPIAGAPKFGVMTDIGLVFGTGLF